MKLKALKDQLNLENPQNSESSLSSLSSDNPHDLEIYRTTSIRATSYHKANQILEDALYEVVWYEGALLY